MINAGSRLYIQVVSGGRFRQTTFDVRCGYKSIIRRQVCGENHGRDHIRPRCLFYLQIVEKGLPTCGFCGDRQLFVRIQPDLGGKDPTRTILAETLGPFETRHLRSFLLWLSL